MSEVLSVWVSLREKWTMCEKRRTRKVLAALLAVTSCLFTTAVCAYAIEEAPIIAGDNTIYDTDSSEYSGCAIAEEGFLEVESTGSDVPVEEGGAIRDEDMPSEEVGAIVAIEDDGDDYRLEESPLFAMSSGNDAMSSAQSISLNTYVCATSTSTDDQDFYKVELPSSSRYTLSFAGDTQLGDGYRSGWCITAYDFDRNKVIDGVGYGGNCLARSEWTGYFPAGTCYIQVSPEWRLVSGSSYRLRLSTDGFVPNDANDMSSMRSVSSDELEPNNSLATSNLITRGKYVYAVSDSASDQDFYALRLLVAGRYTLSFAGDTQLGDGDRSGWHITAYDFDRNKVIDGVWYGGNGLARSEWTGYFPAGTCYIQVSPEWRLVSGSAYHMRLAGASLSSASVSGIKDKVYSGKAQTQSPVVKVAGVTLKKNTDYTLKYTNNTKVGTATITITGKGNYDGTKRVTFRIAKAANPMRVKAVKRTAKVATVKKKAVTVAAPLKFTSKAQGKVTYAKVAKGSAKCLTVNKTTGKVTVKKGTKKGTYTIKVKVKAAGNANYKAGSKTVTCKVAVK